MRNVGYLKVIFNVAFLNKSRQTFNKLENPFQTMNSEKCANEPVYQKKLAYMKFFSIGPQEVHKPDPGPEKKFSTNNAEFNT